MVRRASLILCVACAGCAASAVAERSNRARPELAIKEKERDDRPRLVVSVVLDQVGSWVLERHLPELPEDGALRTAIARGALHRRVVYEHASTLTAPGHAAIYTGAPPAESGIMTNKTWHRARKALVGVTDDGESAVLGRATAFASPKVIRMPGVADVLSEEVPESKVVSISIKDRAAILPGGKHPDLALWFDDAQRRFTTSSWYSATLPGWLDAWHADHPVAAPITVAALSDRLFELAAASSTAMQLGDDEAVDLLAISVSATDTIGHTFGAESREAADMLRRVDRALDLLIEALERRTSVALFVTADHGAAPLVESSRAAGRDAHRFREADVVAAADAAIDRAIRPGDWAVTFQQPFLYLADDARVPEVRDRAVAAAVEALRRVPGIAQAWDVTEARTFGASDDDLRRRVFASVGPDAPGDVFVVPAEWSYFDEEMPRGAGTTHGSPWRYDSEVFAIIAGPGVSHLDTNEPLAARRLTATLAALLGVPPPPAAAAAAPLAGVTR